MDKTIICAMAIIFLMTMDLIMIFVILSLHRELEKARMWIHKLINGDNIDMSIETLALYYHISEERIDQLLTMERDYIDDGK